jgi:copper transport protein
MRKGPRLARLPAAFVLTIVLAAAFAPSAFAHAVLIATQPGNDEVVPRSPEQVILEFDEPVDVSLGSLRVFDGDGEQVDDGNVSQPLETEVAVGLQPELPPGTYTVGWRVVSADSDPVSGAFVFHVIERGTGASVSIEALTSTPESVSIVFAEGRFLDLALLLLVVGGSASLAVALPSAEWGLRRRLYGILAGAAGTLALVALLDILLQGAAASGSTLADALSWDLFSAVLKTRYGEIIFIQAAMAGTLGLTALALRYSEGRERRPLIALTLVLSAGLSLTPSFSGHASTIGGLGLASDILHVVAAALWTGGLAFLVIALRLAEGDRWPLATRAVPRFSTMAVYSVAVLIVAGLVSAYLQVRTWRGLWETEYGLLLLAKIVLALPLLALGAYNNRFAVPRLKAGIASPLERRRFLQVTAVELAILGTIVAVTAVLINTRPAAAELGIAAVGAHVTPVQGTATGPERPSPSFVGTVALGNMQAAVTVDPSTPGDTTITLAFTGSREVPSEVKVAASLPARGIGPLDFAAKPDPSSPGTFVIDDASLPIAGDWELRIEALVGESNLLTENIVVPIRQA